MAALIVFRAFTRAYFLSLPSTIVQGAKSVEVYFSISLTATSYCGHFSRFLQSSSVIFQRLSGFSWRALKRTSCSSLEMWIQNLTMMAPQS